MDANQGDTLPYLAGIQQSKHFGTKRTKRCQSPQKPGGDKQS